MRKHIKDDPKSNDTLQTSACPDALHSLVLGIDLGDRWSQVCVLNNSGHVVKRTRVRTEPTAFRQYFADFAGASAVIETGTHCGWVNRVLRSCKVDVTVANAREIRKIHQSNRKNDRLDAETLARLFRVDQALLSPVHLRGSEMQADIAQVRARDAVVQCRTACINTARGLVKAWGARLPKCTADAFVHRVAEHVPDELASALEPLLQTIKVLTEKIRFYDHAIETLAERKYPQTQLLQQVDGVGPLTALTFLLTLHDAERFKHSRDVGAYLGLVPRQYDSGDQTPQLPITKAGNCYLRRLLVQSAHYILGPFGPDCQLRRHGEHLMQRGGNNAKKRAIVAVARKLAVVLHQLWATGAVYNPFFQPQVVRAA